METTISTKQRIINTLLLNTSFIDNPGLIHGKMGISIFFFHFARQMKNQIYEDYAGELIDEIYEEITLNTPVDFENGLAGIGWGIEYLVQNKFIEADTDEVLEEFDNRVFKELIYNTPKEIGLLNGIVGIGAYFLKRIQNPASNDEKIPTLTNKQTLIHLIDELERQTQDISKIILEPETTSEKPERSNNVQTVKHPDSNLSDVFDITWDYPVLLWFLAELNEQNIFHFKVDKIIQRLTEPFAKKTTLPKLQCNRLLLALALTKLQQTLKQGSNQRLEQSNTETIITKLLKVLNRETIKSELLLNNSTIKHGASGIAWIYKQLYKLTSDSIYKVEMDYWLTHCTIIESEFRDTQSFMSATIRKENVFGILKGYTGMILTSL